jgi:hypothetical protein
MNDCYKAESVSDEENRFQTVSVARNANNMNEYYKAESVSDISLIICE